MSRIAVLIPVYNQPRALERTLASIDQQSADLEIFVVDDASDPPLAVDEQRWRHPLHLLTLQRNSGCTEARNMGLKTILGKGFDYVALQDAGDTDIGERMAMQAAYLDTHPDCAVVGGAANYVSTAGELLYVYLPPVTSQDIRKRMPYVSAFAHPASMIRLSALEAVGHYDPAYPIAGDYELFFRLTARFETANLPDVLINKEDNPNNLSIGRRRESLLYRLKAQAQHFAWPSIHAYLGMAWTCILLLFPYSLVVAFKRWRGVAH